MLFTFYSSSEIDFSLLFIRIISDLCCHGNSGSGSDCWLNSELHCRLSLVPQQENGSNAADNHDGGYNQAQADLLRENHHPACRGDERYQ